MDSAPYAINFADFSDEAPAFLNVKL